MITFCAGRNVTTFDCDVFPPLSAAKTLKLYSISGSKNDPLMKRILLVNAGLGSNVQSQSSMSSVIVSTPEIESGLRS